MSVYIRPRMVDDGTGARGRGLTSSGGPPVSHPRAVSHDVIKTNTHALGTLFDTLIRKARGAYYRKPDYIQQGQVLVSWTAAGPLRPEMHMRARNLRHEEQAHTIEGLHTNPPVAVAGTNRLIVNRPGMRPARQNRNTVANFRGQSFSQTTRNQGA